jgi:O-antigen ligase
VILLVSGGLIGVGVPLLVSGPATEAVALVLGLVLMLAAPSRGGLLRALTSTLKTPLGLAAIGLLLAWLPSVALSLSPLHSLSIWGRTIGLMLAAALIACSFRRSAETRTLALKALVISALACGALALIGIHGSSAFYAPFRGKPFASFDAALFLKYYASAVACLAPAVLFAGVRLGGAWRGAALAYAPMALAIVLSLASGAGLLGLIAALVVGGLVWLSGLRGLRLPALGLLAALIALGLAGLGYLFANAPAPPPAELIVDGHYDGPLIAPLPLWLVDAHRQQIWGFSLDAALDAPWFGHGLDMSNRVPNADAIITWFNQAFVPAHPHNWLIEVLVDAGFVGLSAILGALGVLIAQWFAIARNDRLLGAAGLGLTAAFFASSLLNFSFWLTWWQTVFLVLSAILLAAAPVTRSRGS